MTQNIEDLTPEDSADVEAKRDWVRGHYEPQAQHKYETVDGKLALLDAILENGWVSAEDTLKLQCLGITFGDALAQHLGLTWVAVQDEYGRDPALRLDGTSVLVFPLTAISKRIERGEAVDVFDLFNAACSTIQDTAQHSA
ncbi:hypothetical protein N800_13590 [Lysobacter daejeonensis GH1-9]|uniref:DUF3806 domain-containing protein n=1 Tax=Lysobacter daejeonensis GH1-9 TaxID=1385517 RepID=A0A0A0EKB6_9GAMM|nr:DUF3806 domain-containing protein [Lysobacter daejeonensis]KGM51406.1 hypothetical protein N800_13590 [Lysobacter daejeonensis GH1-9]